MALTAIRLLVQPVHQASVAQVPLQQEAGVTSTVSILMHALCCTQSCILPAIWVQKHLGGLLCYTTRDVVMPMN